ncbi:hypothetical protein K8S19_00855 [bacterium]|nr:hypothetical protein [bacterium]
MPDWIWTLIGLSAAALTATSFIPQLIAKIKKPGSVRMANGTLAVFMAGVFFWFLYGFHLGDGIIIIANGFIFCNLAAIAFLQWREKETK